MVPEIVSSASVADCIHDVVEQVVEYRDQKSREKKQAEKGHYQAEQVMLALARKIPSVKIQGNYILPAEIPSLEQQRGKSPEEKQRHQNQHQQPYQLASQALGEHLVESSFYHMMVSVWTYEYNEKIQLRNNDGQRVGSLIQKAILEIWQAIDRI